MPIQQQPQERKVKGIMDIVFCIDATGSMEPCINELKNEISSFIDSLHSAHPELGLDIVPDWRARIIYFRDIDVDTDALGAGFDFVDTAEELKNQIEQLEAKGGGDEPESSLDALYAACYKSNWRSADECVRSVVLFTDATAKLELNPGTIEPGEDPSPQTIIQGFSVEGIKFFAYCPECEVYERLSRIPKSSITYVGKPDTKEVYEGLKSLDFPALLLGLAKTLSRSAGEVVRFRN